jgi:adenosylhomocysteine nucleosidase
MSAEPSPRDGSQGLKSLRWLVLFAVKEEAAGFTSQFPFLATMLTGMGRQNATRSLATALERWRPHGIISAGFAGGLNPGLRRGSVIFELDPELALDARLRELGAFPGRFHCAERIAVSVADKAVLRQQTGADAVEMESAVIRATCREAGILSATIRVISDAADEDLPLDFNALLTPAHRINWWKFTRAIAFKPRVVSRLIQFQRQTLESAGALGRLLNEVVKLKPGQGVP